MIYKIPQGMIGRILTEVEDALESAKLENANFSEILPEDKYPTNEKEVNEFIKNRVRLHHESWVYARLESVIELLNQVAGMHNRKK